MAAVAVTKGNAQKLVQASILFPFAICYARVKQLFL